MAISAVVTLPSSSLPVGSPDIQALLTISNSGSSEIFITQVVPQAWSTPEQIVQSPVSIQLGQCLIPAFRPVPAGGSLPLTFSVCFNAGSGLGTISISALVYGADGELIEATPGTITIVGVNQNA
jgi:hypothetical protein